LSLQLIYLIVIKTFIPNLKMYATIWQLYDCNKFLFIPGNALLHIFISTNEERGKIVDITCLMNSICCVECSVFFSFWWTTSKYRVSKNYEFWTKKSKLVNQPELWYCRRTKPEFWDYPIEERTKTTTWTMSSKFHFWILKNTFNSARRWMPVFQYSKNKQKSLPIAKQTFL